MYFVVNVQSSPRIVSRYLLHTVFFIFSILSPFSLQPFMRKENQILTLFFRYEGHNFFITFLSIPKLVYIVCWFCLLCTALVSQILSSLVTPQTSFPNCTRQTSCFSSYKCTSPNPCCFFLFTDVLFMLHSRFIPVLLNHCSAYKLQMWLLEPFTYINYVSLKMYNICDFCLDYLLYQFNQITY